MKKFPYQSADQVIQKAVEDIADCVEVDEGVDFDFDYVGAKAIITAAFHRLGRKTNEEL